MMSTESELLSLALLKKQKQDQTITKLRDILKELWSQLKEKRTIPVIKVKSRSKKNLIQHELGYFMLGSAKMVKKSLKTKGGAKELLKLVKTIVYILTQLEAGKTSTVREYFYGSLNWVSDAQFEDVQEANYCLENLEILVDELRENFGIVAESDGCIYGPLVLETQNRKGKTLTIDCQESVSDTGFLLPRKFEDMKIVSHDIKFGLVVETGGFFSRLIEDNFYEKHKCLLVHSKGQPSRCLRQLVKHLSEQYKIPFYGFSDADSWGALIINSIKRGSVKSSHLSDKLCTPSIKHIGLLPSQIERFNLPCDNITKEEKKIAELMLKDERAPPELKRELEIMLQTGKKAEQQGLSYWGISYVSEVYLELILKEANAPIVTTVTEADIKSKK